MAHSPTKSSSPSRRRSHFIRRKQATNFAPAIRLAEQLGTPLNWFVTLNFTHTACDIETVSSSFARLRDNYFTPWHRRPGRKWNGPRQAAAYLWVVENTNGNIAAHWLLHLAPKRIEDFTHRLPKWLSRVTGGIECVVSAIDVRPAPNPAGLRKYLLKGIDPAYAEFYRIVHVPQGEVVGKRCGFSRSLGPSACREARTYHSQMQRDRKAARAAANDRRRNQSAA